MDNLLPSPEQISEIGHLLDKVADSPLGVLSLTILLLAFLVLAFFKKSPNLTKIFVIFGLVASVLGLLFEVKNPNPLPNCSNFSGVWKSEMLAGGYKETMVLKQNRCEIEGSIDGRASHKVKGKAVEDSLQLDVERLLDGKCLNILRVALRRQPSNSNRLDRTITEVVGSCGVVVSTFKTKDFYYEKF